MPYANTLELSNVNHFHIPALPGLLRTYYCAYVRWLLHTWITLSLVYLTEKHVRDTASLEAVLPQSLES